MKKILKKIVIASMILIVVVTILYIIAIVILIITAPKYAYFEHSSELTPEEREHVSEVRRTDYYMNGGFSSKRKFNSAKFKEQFEKYMRIEAECLEKLGKPEGLEYNIMKSYDATAQGDVITEMRMISHSNNTIQSDPVWENRALVAKGLGIPSTDMYVDPIQEEYTELVMTANPENCKVLEKGWVGWKNDG